MTQSNHLFTYKSISMQTKLDSDWILYIYACFKVEPRNRICRFLSCKGNLNHKSNNYNISRCPTATILTQICPHSHLYRHRPHLLLPESIILRLNMLLTINKVIQLQIKHFLCIPHLNLTILRHNNSQTKASNKEFHQIRASYQTTRVFSQTTKDLRLMVLMGNFTVPSVVDGLRVSPKKLQEEWLTFGVLPFSCWLVYSAAFLSVWMVVKIHRWFALFVKE